MKPDIVAIISIFQAICYSCKRKAVLDKAMTREQAVIDFKKGGWTKDECKRWFCPKCSEIREKEKYK